jgi:hypothetical protein
MTTNNWDERHMVSYRLRLSIRYHQRRLRFFESFDLWIKAIAVIASSAVVGAILKNTTVLAVTVTCLITITSALSLVFGFSTKARLHSELVRKYSELEAQLERKVSPTEDELADLSGKIRELEGSEPPTLGALVVLCQNEIARSEGQQSSIVPLRWYQRMLAHLWDFSAPGTNVRKTLSQDLSARA